MLLSDPRIPSVVLAAQHARNLALNTAVKQRIQEAQGNDQTSAFAFYPSPAALLRTQTIFSPLGCQEG